MPNKYTPQLDFLLQLPLWQGMTHHDVFAIAEHVPLHFRKVAAGRTIVRQGDMCDALIFVIDGEVEWKKASEDYAYSLLERTNVPAVIDAHCLFGMHTRYDHTVVAVDDANVMAIQKSDVRNILFDFPTFRVNLLNMLSYQSQRREYRLWRQRRHALVDDFVDFVLNRCVRPAGYKTLKIDMARLGKELGTARLNISKMLSELRREGLVKTTRGSIIIPHFEQLVNR